MHSKYISICLKKTLTMQCHKYGLTIEIKIIGVFLSQWGITLTQIAQMYIKSNLT